MKQIKSGKIRMKPRWYFAVGSALLFFGVTGISVLTVFCLNLTFFWLRRHGPMGQWRQELMIESFPWWLSLAAAAGLIAGIWLLKRYDFSYRKNFLTVIVGFIAALVLAAILIDRLGLNDTWSHRGPMRRFYQQKIFREI